MCLLTPLTTSVLCSSIYFVTWSLKEGSYHRPENSVERNREDKGVKHRIEGDDLRKIGLRVRKIIGGSELAIRSKDIWGLPMHSKCLPAIKLMLHSTYGQQTVFSRLRLEPEKLNTTPLTLVAFGMIWTWLNLELD